MNNETRRLMDRTACTRSHCLPAIAAVVLCACCAPLGQALTGDLPIAPPATDASARSASPPPAEAGVAQARMAEWVDQLDDDRFAVRESAQQRLAQQNAAALAIVGAAADAGSLERTTRAVNILLGWSQSDDKSLSLGALEQLAALKSRPAESAMAASRLADVREAAALKAIAELGARVEYSQTFVNAGAMGIPMHVVIGPEWKGGSRGLKHLHDLRRVSKLSFYSAPLDELTDADLTDLPALPRLEIYGTKVAPQALAKLRERMPPDSVDVRSGAKLGVAGDSIFVGAPAPAGGGGNAKGAIVAGVQEGSAAAKAGVKQGDVITEIDGVAVEDFPHLTREIAKCQAGESVTLKIIRIVPQPAQQPQAQTLDIKVTFDRWGDEAPPAANPNPPLAAPNQFQPLGVPAFGAPGIGIPARANNRR